MKAKHGFTLIEVLIALSILIIGIVAAMKMFPISLERARLAAEKEVASRLADDRLSRLRIAGARSLFLSDFDLNRTALSLSAVDAINNMYTNYNLYEGYNTTVQRMGGAAEVYLQRVNFSVSMPDGRSETFVTYVTEQ